MVFVGITNELSKLRGGLVDFLIPPVEFCTFHTNF